MADIKFDINNLDGVILSKSEAVQKVLEELSKFLNAVESQNEDWAKLKDRLMSEAPYFLPKIQLAFVYYFSKLIDIKYIGSDDDVKSETTLKGKLKELDSFINSDSELIKYYKYLFSGESSIEGIAVNTVAKNFISDTLHVKHSLLGLSVNLQHSKNVTVEDFFKDIESIFEKDNEIQAFTNADVATQNSDPRIKLAGHLAKNVIGKKALKVPLGDGLVDNSYLDTLVDNLKDVSENLEKIKTELKNYLNEHSKDIITDDNAQATLKELSAIIYPVKEEPKEDKAEKKSDDKSEEVKEAINTENLTDALAINVANYLAGKITAAEFQQTDSQIRASEDQTLNETIF